MLLIKIFSERKKILKRERSVRKFMQRGLIFCKGWSSIYRQKIPTVTGDGPGDGYQQKDKNQAKPDKTEHGMEKLEKSKSTKKSTKSKSKVKDKVGSKEMLNGPTQNYVSWSSRLLQYAKSRPNGKLIHNSILNGPYVRRMIAELGDVERDVNEKKAKLFNEWERFTSNEGESIESYYYRFLKLMNDLKRNKHFPEKIANQEMLVIKIFSERKKIFRETTKCEKIRAKRSDFLQGMEQYL
nr:hypothetical protein [Tanacetum cinerariifolium]